MADQDLQASSSHLFSIIARSDITALKHTLSIEGVDIEARDATGWTALHLAISTASAEICRCLIDHGAHVDSWTRQGEATVHIAARRGEVDILRIIMESLPSNQGAVQDGPNTDPKADAGSDREQAVHVNSLTRKHKMSPVYIAVALAHVETAEILLNNYNADGNVYAGQLDIRQGLRSVHILEAALQHPRDICRSLVKMLLQHGASIFNTSTRTVAKSVLQLAIVRNQDVMDIFVEHDSQNFIHTITKVIWRESTRCDTPLTWTIKCSSEDAAFKLLSYGAPPQLTFDTSLDAEVDFARPGKSALENVQEYFWQPILAAAENEMPRLVMELLDRGADPNSSLTTEEAWYMNEHRDCRSVLDIVKAKLIELRNWHKEDEQINYDNRTPEETKQLAAKESAVTRLIRGYEEAEVRLVTLGAKVTDGANVPQESIAVPLRPQKRIQLGVSHSEGINTQIASTLDADIRDVSFTKLKTIDEGHSALFAACKKNDLRVVKALTLGAWGVDSKFPPIAISEVSGYSKGPYLIAVKSRNYDLARTIVHIATVQYIDFAAAKTDSGHLDVEVCGLLADDAHSIESVKSISKQVKSPTTSKTIVLDSNAYLFGEEEKDMEMLEFAIDAESCFAVEQSDINRHARHVWDLVERGGWPNGFEAYIRATGAPFKHMVVYDKLRAKIQLDKPYQVSPLLHAARFGNLNMVRFFLDKERAIEAYKDFAAHHEFDIRYGSIERSQKQFLDAVQKWITHQADLVLHCAVTSRNMDLVTFLVSTHPEFLEVKSIDGWTPLLVAAMVGRIEALQILLDAGSHPLATDPLERNMLHLLLVSPGMGTGLSDPNALSSFLRSMDNVILRKLLEHRCVENPGGLTPLARWILLRPEPNVVFQTVLELSSAAVFETLDGQGCTPLHIVTRSSMENLIYPIIEKSPDILFFEDTNKKTPLDVATEKQLHGLLEGFVSTYARSGKWPTPSPLLHWPLFAFDTSYNGPTYTRDPYKTWEICQGMVNSIKSEQVPRKLSTKYELDEVTQLWKNKKTQKQPKGDQHDVISLVIYKPGNRYW